MSAPTSMSADLTCHTVRNSKALVEKSTKGETRAGLTAAHDDISNSE